MLLVAGRRPGPVMLAAIVCVPGLLAAGVLLEQRSLEPPEGQLVYYRESLYGRITVHRDREQFTLFEDGVPLFSSQNTVMAEETAHYPLSQVEAPRRILLISTEGGVIRELQKYGPKAIDYVELNPVVSEVLFKYRLIEKSRGLNVIHRDGRAHLSAAGERYDAILLNLPEPDTFQLNRFYTVEFFRLAAARLSPGGVFSFSTEGYDNYLGEPQRQKVSSLFNSAGSVFRHVVLLPGQRIYFICGNRPLDADIPALLAEKGVETSYIGGFYYGNVTPRRIEQLNSLVDPSTPRNFDKTPHLIRIMFRQWFSKFAASPLMFLVALTVCCGIYIIRMIREEFVLFSTGCTTMGSEILVIFAFQTYFGYIYFQIGVIVTVFLAGLLPGALLGARFRINGRFLLILTDALLVLLMGIFILALTVSGEYLPVPFYLGFGFLVSLCCGFQFPVALGLQADGSPAATRFFSADLMGAAAGTLFTSLLLIPYLGLIKTALAFMGLKCLSIFLTGAVREKSVPKALSVL